jgi:hypothetical protein
LIITLAPHRLESPRERVALLVEDAQHVAERRGRHRLAGICQHLQDELARWQRVLVFLPLAFEVRIGVPERLRALRGLGAGGLH